jgi:hypothetical protein
VELHSRKNEEHLALRAGIGLGLRGTRRRQDEAKSSLPERIPCHSLVAPLVLK